MTCDQCGARRGDFRWINITGRTPCRALICSDACSDTLADRAGWLLIARRPGDTFVAFDVAEAMRVSRFYSPLPDDLTAT